MALVYSYIRISSKNQMLSDSLRRQTAMSDEWIARNGHERANLTLRDMGVSAFRGKNRDAGALKDFLDAIEAGKVSPGSILLVEKLDRLSQEGVYESFTLFTRILSAGVNIAVMAPYEMVYSKESLNDPIRLLSPLVCFYSTNLERVKRSERQKMAWRAKKQKASNQAE